VGVRLHVESDGRLVTGGGAFSAVQGRIGGKKKDPSGEETNNS